MKTIEGLIGEIRGLANGRVNLAQLDELTDEVRAHLDAAFRARLELGQTPEGAEEEAVRGFGDPVTVINDFAQLHPVRTGFRVDRGVTMAFLASSGALTIFIATSADESMSTAAVIVYLALWLLGFGLIATKSWQARRLQLLPLLIATVFSTFLYATIQEPNYSADPLGSFASPISNKNLNKSFLDGMHRDMDSRSQEKEFGAKHQEFLEGITSSGANLLIPELKVGDTIYRFTDTSKEKMVDLAEGHSQLIYVPETSVSDAEKTWSRAVPAAMQIFQFNESRAVSSVIQDSIQTTRPAWLNYVLLLPNSFSVAAMIVLMLGVAHVTAVFARFLSSRRRQGPRLA